MLVFRLGGHINKETDEAPVPRVARSREYRDYVSDEQRRQAGCSADCNV